MSVLSPPPGVDLSGKSNLCNLFVRKAASSTNPPDSTSMQSSAEKTSKLGLTIFFAIWGGLLGGVTGFVAGGPVGAVIGAIVGAALGAGIGSRIKEEEGES